MSVNRCILGATQKGKTELALKFFRESPCLAIFFNTDLEEKVIIASDVSVKTFEKLQQAISEGYTKICYNPAEDYEVALYELKHIKNLLWRLSDRMKGHVSSNNIFCDIFIDEIQDLQGKHDIDKDVEMLFKRNLKRGIRTTAISQRPADVHHTILTQSGEIYVFYVNFFEAPYFQRYKAKLTEEHFNWIKQPYHFLLFKNEEIYRVKPIDL